MLANDEIELMEKEREDFISKLEEIRLQYKRQHELEWTLRRREEEIESLKEALSNAQLYIFDEREHSMKLQQENDTLRIQELEDRRKIRELLSLCKPATHLPRPDLVISSSKISKSKVSDIRSPRVVRSVIIPNEKMESLVLQIESLHAQLEEQEKLFKQKEEVILKERSVQMEEEKIRSERDRATIQQLQTELHRVENLLNRTNREYFVLSHNAKIAERKHKEQSELLKAENANLMKQIEILKEKSRKDAKRTLIIAKQESEEVANHFRQQAIERENDVLVLQDQLNQHRERYEAKMKMMEKKLKAFEDKYKNLSARRAIDLEGFNSDVTLLRKHIQKLESKIARAVTIGCPPNNAQVRKFEEDQHFLASTLSQLKEKLSNVERQIRGSRA